jgi:hypothetical protein
MNHMKKTILLAPLLFLWLVAPVRALEPGMTAIRPQTEPKRFQIQDMRDTHQASRSAEKQARCEGMADKINFRINQSEKNRDRSYTAFQNIKKYITAFITRATSRGCDVTTLKTQLTGLDPLIEKFSAAFRDWKNSVQAARELRCDPSETKTTRAAADVVRAYIQNTLKPTLTAAVQACKPSPRPSASPSASPEVKGDQ